MRNDSIQLIRFGKDDSAIRLFGHFMVDKLSDEQLLDLGMKIQNVINQIDRENRLDVRDANKPLEGCFSELD